MEGAPWTHAKAAGGGSPVRGGGKGNALFCLSFLQRALAGGRKTQIKKTKKNPKKKKQEKKKQK